MTLWFIFSFLIAVAAAIVAYPFIRDKRSEAVEPTGVEVYKDQLAEVDRDKEQGLIDEKEADLARTEIERRILTAARNAETAANSAPARYQYQTVTGVAAIVVLGSVGLYAALGQPELFYAQQRAQIAAAQQGAAPAAGQQQATQNAASAQSAAAGQGNIDALVKRLETRLKDNPNDPDGWRVLGWSYYNTGRYQNAVDAYRRAVDLQKDNANVRALYGEALVRAADGRVTDEAIETFEKVLVINPNDERARFFKGLAKEQNGDNQGAIDEWLALYKIAPADAEWTGDLRLRIQQLAAKSNINVDQRLAEARPADAPGKVAANVPPHAQPAPADGQRGPTAEDIENAKQLSSEDQQAMVRGMVDRLASRLESSPNDVDGWIMLIRSHIALNEQDKARAALERANEAFSAEPETQKRIAEAAQVMGVSLKKE
jgi:cytochrome c-type biogenesis protein CcmH